MSGAIAGFNGGLYVMNGTAANKVLEVTEANLKVGQKLIDSTSFDSDGWEENIDGMKNFTIDADALYRSNDTTGQDVLYAALTNGTSSVVQLWPKDTSSALGYTGSVRVESFELGVPKDDAVTISVSLTGTGALHTASKS